MTTSAMPLRALALELTKGCNLRCGYCYYAQREEAYDPRSVMSPEVARAAVDRLLKEGPDEGPLHLHFFGGEPLLAFGGLKDAVEYAESAGKARNRVFTYEVTTNGTRFTPEINTFLNLHAVHVGVSFDGPPEIQDAARPAFGRSSYEMAVEGIRSFLSSRRGTSLESRVHASMVVTRRNFDVLALTRHLEDLGFIKIVVSFATDLVGNHESAGPDDLHQVYRELDRLAADTENRIRAGRPVAVTWFPRLISRVGAPDRRMTPCGGGRDYLGVDAEGNVALCYRFFEDKDHALGSVQDGIQRDLTKKIESLPFDQREPCRSCWARYFCGGGCHHDNLLATGEISGPNPVACDIFRHSMDRALDVWGRVARSTRSAVTNTSTRLEAIPLSDSDSAFQPSDRPLAKTSCHIRELDNERVVYEPTSHEVVVLNSTAGFIFGLCDGQHTVQEMLDRLAGRYSAPRDLLARDLKQTLQTFRDKQLLQG